MSKIIFVHGIESNGSQSTDLMLKLLKEAGRAVVESDYERVHWWNARYRNVQLDRASRILDMSKDGDHIVAHSFGGLIARRAMQLNRKFGHVFLFSPADEANTYYPILGAKKIHIIYNQFDKPIRLGALLPNHDFGELGRMGYEGPDDPRVVALQDPYYRVHSSTHGHYFQRERIEKWATYILEEIDNG